MTRKLFIWGALLSVAVGPLENDNWRWQSLLGMFALSVYLSWKIYKKFSAPVSVAFLYWSYLCLSIFIDPNTPYAKLGRPAQVLADVVTASSYSWLVLFASFALLVSRYDVLLIIEGLGFLCLINSFLRMFNLFIPEIQGFFANSSHDSLFILLTYPLMAVAPNKIAWVGKDLKRWVNLRPFLFDVVQVLLPIAAILTSKSTTAIIGIIFFFSVLVLRSVRPYAERWLGVGFLSVLVGLGMYFNGTYDFADGNGRVPEWRLAMQYFHDKVDPLVGAGPGTFYMHGPVMQMQANQLSGGYFIWLHNEWLQILFETGFAGFLIFAYLASDLLVKSFSRRWLFALVSTFLLTMTTQMYFRFFWFSLVATILVVLVYWGDREDRQTL